MPEFDVRFYPYIGINHTIRIRDGKIYVRITEICRDMPLPAHCGLAYILVSKLLRKRVPPQARERYSKHIKTAELRAYASDNKRTRGRVVVTTPKASVYDI